MTILESRELELMEYARLVRVTVFERVRMRYRWKKRKKRTGNR